MLEALGSRVSRRWGRRTRLLRCRARRVEQRAPLILVPPVLAVRLVDGGGREVWGSTRRLFFGPSVSFAANVRPAGLVEGFRLLPGLPGQDLFGAWLRFLEDVGGYRRGEDIFHLDYDWRGGVDAGAETLDALVARIVGCGSERVDLLCVSSGGLVARHFLAGGGDARRVVYVACPQRGSLSSLGHLNRGVTFVPFGRRFDRAEVARTQVAYDCLPHPSERVFIDSAGRSLDIDLYDADVWRRFSLGDPLRRDLQHRLDRARDKHIALDRAPVHPDAIVIGGDHVATPHRITIDGGRAILTDCCSLDDNPAGAAAHAPGDGDVPASSLLLPGMPSSAVWRITPQDHHLIPSEAEVHRLALEALLATDRAIPPFDLAPTIGSAHLVRT